MRCKRCGFSTSLLDGGLCYECRDVLAEPDTYGIKADKPAPTSVMSWRKRRPGATLAARKPRPPYTT